MKKSCFFRDVLRNSKVLKVSSSIVTMLIFSTLAAADSRRNRDDALGDSLTPDQLAIADNAPHECGDSGPFLGYGRDAPKDVAIVKARQDRMKLPRSVESQNGQKLPTADWEGHRRLITNGPAKLLDKPSGNAIDSYPTDFAVLIAGKKDDWYYIRGYWERTCDTGWVQENNLRSATRAQIKELKKKQRSGPPQIK